MNSQTIAIIAALALTTDTGKANTVFNRSGVGINTRKKRTAQQRRRKNKQRKAARAVNRKRGQKMK